MFRFRPYHHAVAAIALVLLLFALFGCADPGVAPDGRPNSAPVGLPRGLTGQDRSQQAQAPAVQRPVDIEARPYTGVFRSNDEIQEFRIVVDEVWRWCLVNAKGGMACFEGADAP